MTLFARSPRPLHIGFIAQGWAPDIGGIESHTADLVRELIARGHRVSALALDYSERRAPYETWVQQDEPEHVTRMSYGYHDHDHLARVVHNRDAEEVVATWAREREPDVVHVHHLTGFGMGALARLRGEGLATVMTLHDYWPLCPRGQMMRFTSAALGAEICTGLSPDTCGACLAASFPHLMPSHGALLWGPYDGPEREDGRAREEHLVVPPGADPDGLVAGRRTAFAIECLLCANLLITPSERTRSIYARVCTPMGLDASAIQVVENGVDVGGLAGEVKRLRLSRVAGGPLVLGVVGSVLPSKGVLELALAFAEAKAAGRFEAAGGLRLEVHGSLPAYHGERAYVEALLDLAEDTPGLEVMGPFDHGSLGKVLARLDGVAAPSRWEEVFGLTVREARAAGLPVLVSDVGDLPGVTMGGRAGLVVEPPHGDTGRRAWADALQRFVEDTEGRTAWAAHAVAPRSAHEMTLELEAHYLNLKPGPPLAARLKRRLRKLLGLKRES